MAGIQFTAEDARRIGVALGVDWEEVKFDPDEFRVGIELELEQSHSDPAKVTDDDELAAFKRALDRLREHPDHYARAERCEAEGPCLFREPLSQPGGRASRTGEPVSSTGCSTSRSGSPGWNTARPPSRAGRSPTRRRSGCSPSG